MFHLILASKLLPEPFDTCENVMLGHATANKCQSPTHLALLLSQSLCKFKGFDSSDVMARYLYLHHFSKCHIGQVATLVYEDLKSSITTPSGKLTRKHFLFTTDKIYDASKSAHERLKGLSSGCNPAQRSFPLAFCPWINDDDVFRLSCDEARLTHFSPIAGQVAGLINLICRRLLKGDEWNDAVKTAFSSAPQLLGEIQEILTRYEHETVLKSQGHPAYAPNTLHTSLHCVTKADSFEKAVSLANETEPYYCPTIVGILAGARWAVPQSMLANSQQDTLDEIRDLAKCFSGEWNKINSKKKNDSKK